MKECHETHLCYCGIKGGPVPHVIGVPGCYNEMSPIEPKETAFNKALQSKMWLVDDADGQPITSFTLRFSRGYVQHRCGCWSRRK